MAQDSFARGVNRVHSIGRELVKAGTPALVTAGKQLRRVSATPNFSADAIRSNEILPSHQIRDARLGTGRGQIAFQGQLSPGAYPDFFEGMLRRDFSAGVTSGAVTGLTAASGPPGTITRSAGSWITDGFRVGDIVRQTGWTTTGVPNNGRNIRITGLTATVMTTSGLGNEAIAAKAAETGGVTTVVVGKKTWIPLSGHVFPSYTWEDWQPDTSPANADVYVGTRFQQIRINMGPTGIIMLDAQMVAKDLLQGVGNGSRYFTSPSVVTTDASLSAPQGTVRFNGIDVATITGLNLVISTPIEANPSSGSKTVAEIFQGAISVEGTVTVYFTDTTYRDAFRNETEGELYPYFPSDGTLNSAFIAMAMPRLKLLSVNRSDGPMSLLQTLSFQALENVSTGVTALERTTFSIQDSSLT